MKVTVNLESFTQQNIPQKWMWNKNREVTRVLGRSTSAPQEAMQTVCSQGKMITDEDMECCQEGQWKIEMEMSIDEKQQK